MRNQTHFIAFPARSFIILFFLFGTFFTAFAQKQVTGVVKSNNNPVVGATVEVQGTNVATSTGMDGKFSIVVPAGKNILVISSVGYGTHEANISNLSNVEINLSVAVTTINEVVVTGYSSQRKKDITGAVSVVNVSELKSQPTFDAQSQLQGRASGVTVIQNGVPGSGSTVRIRGLASFNNNNPLYVVDGVQTGSITGLNPNDIESMQVLKDAASASIYGVRATNGVIIITTKKGKKRGVSVAYDVYYGSQNPGKGLEFLNAQEQAEFCFWQWRLTCITRLYFLFWCSE